VEIISPYHQILSVMMMFAVALAIVAFGLQVAELVAQRKKRKAPTAAREADQSAR
jgi:NADH:ubiquinone oxidoreductase subunit 3 (subunit A)